MILTCLLLTLTLTFVNISPANSVTPLQYGDPAFHRYKYKQGDIVVLDKKEAVDKIEPDPLKNYRLPSNLVPTSYSLRVLPILDDLPEAGKQFTVPSSITISVNCTQDTNVITLHSNMLDIAEHSVKVKNSMSGEYIPIQRQDYDEDTHFYNITTKLENPLKAGESYEIFIEYVALIRPTHRGYRLYNYTEPGSSETRYTVSTQFQAVAARQVYPCFDQPSWKATYNVTIGRHKNYTALTNGKSTAVQPHETLKDWVWESFETTVPMPSYLLILAVADLAFVKPSVTTRVPVDMWTLPHLVRQGQANYSAEVSANVFNTLEAHVGVDYPMAKLDSIIVPGQLGGMEHYGLISLSSDVLQQDGITTEIERKRLISLISHEMAHQWYGNLVTCQWWSNIWLNEGLATFTQFIGMAKFYNEFIPLKWIINKSVQGGLRDDAKPDGPPLTNYTLNTIPQIQASFTGLQYNKGASLIRMLESILPAGGLQKGLKDYLLSKAHQVVVQDDLFFFLNQQVMAGPDMTPGMKTIKAVMDTWTLQPGYPLVRVNFASGSKDPVTLSQERFINKDEQSNHTLIREQLNQPGMAKWEIPISLATKTTPNFEDHRPRFWLPMDSKVTTISHNPAEWIILNPEATGFYRVLYDSHFTSLIVEQLNVDHSVISPLSRSQLLDDYFMAAFQDYVKIERALDFTQYLGRESDPIVWSTVFTNLKPTVILWSGTPGSTPFKEYMEPLIVSALKLIGVRQPPKERGAVVLLRGELLDWACAMNISVCVSYASELMEEWRQIPAINPFPIDLQGVLYCSAVANGEPSERNLQQTESKEKAFNFFLEKFKNSMLDPQKYLFVSALACAKNVNLLERLLYLSLESGSCSDFPKELGILALKQVALNTVGRERVLRFIQEFNHTIMEHFESPVPIVGVLQSLTSRVGLNVEEGDKLINYIESFTNSINAETHIRTTLDKSVQRMKKNIRWMSEFYERMKAWFESHRVPRINIR